MSKLVIYTRDFCGYSVAAKKLFDKKGVDYEEINATGNAELRQEMNERTGGNTFPQVLIDGAPYGGFDDIYALDQEGKLDQLLGLTAEEPA